MKSSGLFVQIGMIAISIGIILTYIKPTFDEIRLVQQNISTYQKQVADVSGVNDRLTDLISNLDLVTKDDRDRLTSYLPDEIDEISVTRDLLLITNESEATYINASGGGVGSPGRSTSQRGSENLPQAHNFELSVSGTYPQIKRLFELLEQNNYPLEVRGVELSSSDEGLMNVSISLMTYSYKSSQSVGDNLNIITF